MVSLATPSFYGEAVNRGEHYTYRVSWFPEDQAYVGTVAEMPSLSWLDVDQEEAFRGIKRLVADVLEDLHEAGEAAGT